ncbi:MAG: AraC family transcriptional regulator [Verrucomicrobiae bacterium]
MQRPAVFRSDNELYHADSCEPLKQAALRGETRIVALGRGSYPGDRLPAHEIREVSLTGYWDAPHDQTWGLGWHRNEGIELSFVEAGRVPFEIDGKSYMLDPGYLTITRPWQDHRVGNPCVPACRFHWLIIDVGVRRPNQPWRWPSWLLYPKANMERLTTILRQNEQPAWRANEEIAHCFRKLGKAAAGGTGPENITRLKIIINELIIALAEMLGNHNPQLDESLSSTARAVRLFLEELPRRIDEPWTLESMAEQCGLGRSAFASCCKQITNASPVDYLTRCRVDAAAQMLRASPEKNITEVAFSCGFQSSQYFSTVFRAHHACSPREWRARRH